MASNGYDVLILGGGNAGFGVTVPTRKAGMTVAMVEERDLGGTCPNRGCTPKKVLVAAGHALHEIDQAHVHHVSVSKPKLDWAALMDREGEMISGIPESLAATLEEHAVEHIRQESARIGVDVHTGVKVARVEKANKQLRTIFATDGREQAVVSYRVVNGAGRIANVDHLDLDAGGCARRRTPPSMLAAMCSQARRSFHPLPLTRVASSAPTSSRARRTSPTMRAFLPPF